jgi:DNA invertase Pin-like site-specific DNA recombinase
MVKCYRELSPQRANLVVAKLDRLAPNVAFTAKLMESGVEFVAADMPFANKLSIHILAAVAEHEREAISDRTKQALAAAKARGVKLGGPKLKEAQRNGRAKNREKADQFASNTRPVIEQIRRSGITTLRGIAAALNARASRLLAAAPGRRSRSWPSSAAYELLWGIFFFLLSGRCG